MEKKVKHHHEKTFKTSTLKTQLMAHHMILLTKFVSGCCLCSPCHWCFRGVRVYAASFTTLPSCMGCEQEVVMTDGLTHLLASMTTF